MGSGSDEDPFNSIPTMGPGLSSVEIDTTAMVTSCSSSRDESDKDEDSSNKTDGGFFNSTTALSGTIDSKTSSSSSPNESDEDEDSSDKTDLDFFDSTIASSGKIDATAMATYRHYTVPDHPIQGTNT